MKKSWNKRWVLSVWLIIFMAGSALSAGLNVTTYSGNADQLGNTYKVYDKDGNPLAVGSLVQIIKGSAASPDPGKTGFVSSGTLYTNYGGYPAQVGHQNTGVTAVNNVAGELDYNCDASIDPSGAEPFYVRVWNTGSPAQGAYYNWKTGMLKGAGQSPTDMYLNISAVYKADKPMKPKSTASGFSLTYNDGLKQYLPAFTISAVDQNDPDGKTKYEIVGHNIRIRVKGGAWDPARTFVGSSKTITETNTTDPYFKADGVTEYEVQSQAWNYFGGNAENDWGDIFTFKIPATGGMAGPDEAIYNLVKLEEGLGVNTFPIAYSSVQTPAITNVRELVEAIKDTEDKNVVTAIGWWGKDMIPHGYVVDLNADTGVINGYTASAGLPEDPADVPLEKDQCYQVSVTKTVDFQVIGVR